MKGFIYLTSGFSRVKTLIENVVVSIGNNNWDTVINNNSKLAAGSIVGGLG